jgi:hypothetical protein
MRGRVRQFFSSPRTGGCETRVLRSARQESTRLRAGKSPGSEIDRQQQEKKKPHDQVKEELDSGSGTRRVACGERQHPGFDSAAWVEVLTQRSRPEPGQKVGQGSGERKARLQGPEFLQGQRRLQSLGQRLQGRELLQG